MTIAMTDGTLFKRETSTPGTYATIAQVINIKPAARTRKKAEVYIHDQSAPVVKYGAEEAQTVEIELAFDNTSTAHQQFFTDYANKTSVNYKIVYPDSGAREDAFAATIESITQGDQTAEGQDPQTATIVFGLSAAPTTTW